MSDTAVERLPAVRRIGPIWLGDVLPFLTSISLHAGILVAGLLTYHAIQVVKAQNQDLDFVPESPMATEPWIPGLPSDTPTDPALPGFPTAGARRSANSGPEGEGSIGPSPFGVGANGSGGSLGASIFPIDRGRAHKIVFLCDASGSMLAKMASLKIELSEAVRALQPTQSFNIIFFQDQACKTFSRDLAAATHMNKDAVPQFLDGVIAAGTTDPLPGIALAFQERPEVIYLLTDGDFPDNPAVLRKIRSLDADGRVRVHTIAFVNAADTDTDFIALLNEIAHETRGTYKHVLAE